MTAHQLAALLLAGPDDEVFLCATVQSVDAVEACPGDPKYALPPYITLHSACRYPGHDHADDIEDSTGGRIPMQDVIDMVRADHREALDRLADR